MSCGATAALSADSAPAASFAAMSSAPAKNPNFGSTLITFCHAATVVTVASHASGAPVTQAYAFLFAVLMMMAVDTDNAIAASIWLEIPNSGHRMLIPPLGSITPMYRKYHQPATLSVLEMITDGYQDVRPNGAEMCPSRSCNMKRPTRVPASIVVRMNTASNMMAK